MAHYAHLSAKELIALLVNEEKAHDVTRQELSEAQGKTEHFRKHLQNPRYNEAPLESVSTSAHRILGLENEIVALKTRIAHPEHFKFAQTFNPGSQATNIFYNQNVYINVMAPPQPTPVEARAPLRITEGDDDDDDNDDDMEDEDDGIVMPMFSAPCFKERDQGHCRAKICPRVHQAQVVKFGADAFDRLPFDKNAERRTAEGHQTTLPIR
ncbi:hypothetical protein FB567DRAFT_606485 [Paraphoma chrysanthemicola]|uniref:Uncharacterized protein n=1 Tax=Paraphoma chrysanthemicola TaxID=798071 RepID=A0A8K0R2Y7_9PLEO|nr:hypothetical protein FB567DRAFT_606485 [Paraphoma chrysanthemicola]